MPSNVVELTGDRVTMRVCPEPTCGYLMSQQQIDMARLDFDCRCGETTLNDYQPIMTYHAGKSD
jgi:hypothetical protein